MGNSTRLTLSVNIGLTHRFGICYNQSYSIPETPRTSSRISLKTKRRHKKAIRVFFKVKRTREK
jgi:hypothetical protein